MTPEPLPPFAVGDAAPLRPGDESPEAGSARPASGTHRIIRRPHPSGDVLQCEQGCTTPIDRLHHVNLARVGHDCETGTWIIPPQLKSVRSHR